MTAPAPAFFHCQIKSISRADKRSATAAAAYRSGEVIVDERTGTTYDYSHRKGVAESYLILPEGVEMTRPELWNRAEQAERRKDARTAREWEIAFPCDLSYDQCQQLGRRYAQWLVDTYHIGVDINIHRPSRRSDQRNLHAHVQGTTREILPDGSLGAKTRILDDRKTGPAEIERCRETWATMCNEALHAAGIDRQVDHRSYARQGINRTPTIHEGPAVTALERFGEHTRIRAINDKIRRANALLDKAEETQAEADRLKKRAKRLRKQARQVEALEAMQVN